MNHINNYELLTIPADIPENMIVAVQPSRNSSEKYWLAQVIGVKETNPKVYNLRYYNYSKQSKSWKLMRGQLAYGTAAHSAILLAGIEFNINNTMKAHCVKQLQYVLNQNQD